MTSHHHQGHQQMSPHGQQQDSGKPATLWVGDIEKWMDENYLAQLFGKTGIVVSTKIIRDRQTNIPVGYGFVQFNNHETAKKVLELYGNATNPATGRTFRLNWGVRNGGGGVGGGSQPGGGPRGGPRGGPNVDSGSSVNISIF